MASEGLERAPALILSRHIFLEDRTEPLAGHIEASEGERAELAALLKLEDLVSLTFDYRLELIGADRFRLSGQLQARLTQLCVVTLEPLAETIAETVAAECLPENQIEAESNAEVDADATELPEDPPIPIVNGRVDLGAFAAEILASAINPYPRKQDAEFLWEDPKAAPGSASGAFAELAKWKAPR